MKPARMVSVKRRAHLLDVTGAAVERMNTLHAVLWVAPPAQSGHEPATLTGTT